ncbi:Abscisic acid receptor PYL8 [Capsicum annuum]|nr:Abscisic acid receptor PYL8 [Capsicum annuum]
MVSIMNNVERRSSSNSSSSEDDYIRRHHRHDVRDDQCSSSLVKHIKAPVHLSSCSSVSSSIQFLEKKRLDFYAYFRLFLLRSLCDWSFVGILSDGVYSISIVKVSVGVTGKVAAMPCDQEVTGVKHLLEAVYYRPLWSGPSLDPAYSGIVSAPGCLSIDRWIRLKNGVSMVWSLVRRFDQPQRYKPFVSRCIVQGDLEIGSVREVNVKSGLPATTSKERLELLDDDEHIFGVRIVGGDHRLRNYSSIITVHPEIIEGRPGTMVVESFVVDVPDGNTKDETCYFVEALIRCNLKSLADVSERLAVQGHMEPIDRM